MTLTFESQRPYENYRTRLREIIFFRIGNKLEKVDLDEIDIIKSDGNYCTVHAGNRKFVVKKSLLSLEGILPSEMFVRVHMRSLISILKITKIDLGANLVYLEDLKVPIGRRYRSDLVKKLNIV